MASLATLRVTRLRKASSSAPSPPSTQRRRSASAAKASLGAALVEECTVALYAATHLASAALRASMESLAPSGSTDRNRMRSVRLKRSILPLAAPSRTAACTSTIPRPPQMSESWPFL